MGNFTYFWHQFIANPKGRFRQMVRDEKWTFKKIIKHLRNVLSNTTLVLSYVHFLRHLCVYLNKKYQNCTPKCFTVNCHLCQLFDIFKKKNRSAILRMLLSKVSWNTEFPLAPMGIEPLIMVIWCHCHAFIQWNVHLFSLNTTNLNLYEFQMRHRY